MKIWKVERDILNDAKMNESYWYYDNSMAVDSIQQLSLQIERNQRLGLALFDGEKQQTCVPTKTNIQ